jgi:hypothetical protein
VQPLSTVSSEGFEDSTDRRAPCPAPVRTESDRGGLRTSGSGQGWRASGQPFRMPLRLMPGEPVTVPRPTAPAPPPIP